MRLYLACFILVLLAATAARADVILIKPGVQALQTYGPQFDDSGPREWQKNRSAGAALEVGHPFGPHDLSLGAHLFIHNNMSFFLLGNYRHHFGQRDQLHFFAGGGLGWGCINHRDYARGDTCSGAWHLAASGGLWVPLIPRLSLTAELMAIGSGPTKTAFTPLAAASAVVSF